MLSSPTVVCLVVLGKYVPWLKFLDVVLGDEPVLSADIAYYQRLLARNGDDARRIVLTRVGESSVQQAFDEILVPALTYFRRDRNRAQMSEEQAQFVLETTEQLLRELAPLGAAAAEAADSGDRRARTARY